MDGPKNVPNSFVRTIVDRSPQETAPRRRYFCDTEGWVQEALAAALLSCSAPCTRAFPHMRFLHYAEPGGFLPAHTDLCRTDSSIGTSTHTLLLYLEGGESGGETVLLERLEQY